jgi:hypothetical protein
MRASTSWSSTNKIAFILHLRTESGGKTAEIIPFSTSDAGIPFSFPNVTLVCDLQPPVQLSSAEAASLANQFSTGRSSANPGTPLAASRSAVETFQSSKTPSPEVCPIGQVADHGLLGCANEAALALNRPQATAATRDCSFDEEIPGL